MIKFIAELEDVVFTAIRSNDTGDWTVKLEESETAKKDFQREKIYTAKIVLNDREFSALMFLAVNGDEGGEDMVASMYAVIEPKLANVPHFLRPIP